jgi:TP901 family phage tail tape measure protein
MAFFDIAGGKKLVAKVGADIREFQRKMNQMANEAYRASTKIKDSFNRVKMPMLAVGAAVGYSVKVFSDFQEKMNAVKAVTQASASEMEALTAKAKELGIKTQFSAREAAAGMEFLGMAGFKTTEILESMEDVLNLAAAGSLGLAEAADIASNVLTAFRLPASEMSRVADVIAYTAANANTNVRQLGEAMTYVAGTAAGAGVSLEETAALLGIMGNVGLQASMAGTSFNQALIHMLKPTEEAAEKLKKLNIEFDESTGRLTNIGDLFKSLEEAGIGVTEALELFGVRGGRAIQAGMAQGSESVQEFIDNLKNVRGVAKQMAETKMEGLPGAFKEFRSALEGLAIAIGGIFAPVVKVFIRLMTKGFRSVIPFLDELKLRVQLAITQWDIWVKKLFIMAKKIPGLGRLVGDIEEVREAVKRAEIDLRDIEEKLEGVENAKNRNAKATENYAKHLDSLINRIKKHGSAEKETQKTSNKTVNVIEKFNRAMADQEKKFNVLSKITQRYWRSQGQESKVAIASIMEEHEQVFGELQEQLVLGRISWEEYDEAILKLEMATSQKIQKIRTKGMKEAERQMNGPGGLVEGMKKGWEDITQAAIDWAETGESLVRSAGEAATIALEDAFFSIVTGDFENLVDVVKDFGRALERAIMEALAAAALEQLIKILRWIWEKIKDIRKETEKATDALVKFFAVNYVGATIDRYTGGYGRGRGESIWDYLKRMGIGPPTSAARGAIIGTTKGAMAGALMWGLKGAIVGGGVGAVIGTIIGAITGGIFGGGKSPRPHHRHKAHTMFGLAEQAAAEGAVGSALEIAAAAYDEARRSRYVVQAWRAAGVEEMQLQMIDLINNIIKDYDLTRGEYQEFAHLLYLLNAQWAQQGYKAGKLQGYGARSIQALNVIREAWEKGFDYATAQHGLVTTGEKPVFTLLSEKPGLREAVIPLTSEFLSSLRGGGNTINISLNVNNEMLDAEGARRIDWYRLMREEVYPAFREMLIDLGEDLGLRTEVI